MPTAAQPLATPPKLEAVQPRLSAPATAAPTPANAASAPATSPRAVDTFRDCPDVCPEMVVVPAGQFTMGLSASEAVRGAAEGPQRTVRIAKPFAVGKFEVTFAEWDACVAGGGCGSNKAPSDQGWSWRGWHWGRGKRPVINVSWSDANEYLAWLSKKSGQAYRLLSEAEWEYAARAGTTTPFSTGPTITTDQANFDGSNTFGESAKGTYRQKTVEVGTFKPNAFGLHDMHGNVWEWVEDNWHSNYLGAPKDGSAWIDNGSSSRVLRGGSWYSDPRNLRSASRDLMVPGHRSKSVGFRVARTLSGHPR